MSLYYGSSSVAAGMPFTKAHEMLKQLYDTWISEGRFDPEDSAEAAVYRAFKDLRRHSPKQARRLAGYLLEASTRPSLWDFAA